MAAPDIPRNWHHHLDTPRDTPRSDADFAMPPRELVPPENKPSSVADESPDVVAAGDDGLTSPDDLRLMEPPKLKGEAVVATTSEMAKDSPNEPSDTPEETGGQSEKSGSADQAPEAPGPETPDAGGNDQGGGGSEPPDRTPEEADDNNENIGNELKKCLEDIQRTRERLTATDEPPSEDAARKINDACIELAETAGNTDGVRHYLDQMVDPTPKETIDGYLVRNDAGDRAAWDDLHRHLQGESKGSFMALQLEGKREPQPVLDEIMRTCAAQEEPVDEYIKTAASAAPTPEAQAAETRRLFLRYASQVVPGSDSEYATGIKEKADELATQLSDDQMLEAGPYALLVVTDPALNRQIYDRYVDKFTDLESMLRVAKGDETAINALFEAAKDLPKNPAFPASQYKSINFMIDKSIDIMRHAEKSEPTRDYKGYETSAKIRLLRQRAEAHVILNMYAEKPRDAATVCEESAKRAISHQFPDGVLPSGYLEKVCAKEYMKTGNTEGARQLLKGMSGMRFDDPYEDSAIMHAYVGTLHTCWQAATTPEQMDELRPSRLQQEDPSKRLLESYRSVDIEFEYVRAVRFSDDPEYVADLAEKFANRELDVSGLAAPERAAGKLAERLTVLDPAAGQNLAYKILQNIHTQPTDPDIESLSPFYRILAASDNPAHLAMVRQSIRIANGSDASALNEQARLASALAFRMTSGRRN